MKKYNPYLPISIPEQIEVGPYQGQYSVRYRDEHGLVQTHFPFLTSQIAWAYAISCHCNHFKIPLTEIPVSDLKSGDLVLDKNYSLIQITSCPRNRENLFKEKFFAATGVFASHLPNPGIEILVRNAFKLPTENEDFVI